MMRNLYGSKVYKSMYFAGVLLLVIEMLRRKLNDIARAAGTNLTVELSFSTY